MEEKNGHSAKLITFYIVFAIAAIATVFACIFYNFYGSALLAQDGVKLSKAEKYAKLNASCELNSIVFFGDSITEMCDLDYYYPEYKAINRGISGNTTEEMLDRLDSNLIALAPRAVFFLGGANDLGHGSNPTEVNANIKNLLMRVKEALPESVIFVQSVYPVNPNTSSIAGNHVGIRDNADIRLLNGLLKNTCNDLSIKYIDTFAKLVDLEGKLNEDYTFDGLHINAKAYEIVSALVKEETKEILGL